MPDISNNKELSFHEELVSLINRFSKENESNTPDYLLANYLGNCLLNYEEIIRSRDKWYNFNPLTNLVDFEADLGGNYATQVATPDNLPNKDTCPVCGASPMTANCNGANCEDK